MSDQVYEMLGTMRESLGRIEQKADTTLAWMEKHSETQEKDLEAITTDITNLKLAQARQKGFRSAMGAVGTLVGAGFGYLVERWTMGGHH